jgi:NAD(P)-dependent dehydrogenase (short-subunit alcohol dehydrogenase family)
MPGAGRFSGSTAIVTGASQGIGEAIAKTLGRDKSPPPTRSLLQPQDSAEAVLFLASDESRSITGVNLPVNAGAMIV